MFEEATREQVYLRMAIQGPSGSGKTATGLNTAYGLAKHYPGRVAVIDTQHRQSLDYVGTRFAPTPFKVKHLLTGNPDSMRAAIGEAAKDKDIAVLVIDSLSVCWAGDEGLLEKHNDLGGEWKDWGPIGKIQNKLFSTILKCPFHVIVTIQSKTDWMTVEEDHPKIPGKKRIVPVRVGTAPVQRKGFEYWWPLYAIMDDSHDMYIQRINAFEDLDKAVIHKPGPEWVDVLVPWLKEGKAHVEEDSLFGRKASDDQVREWEELAVKITRLDLISCVREFVKKYEVRPADCDAEFLEGKLTELRSRIPSSQRQPRNGGEPATKTES